MDTLLGLFNAQTVSKTTKEVLDFSFNQIDHGSTRHIGEAIARRRRTMTTMDGKKVVIIGGTSGIGLATAHAARKAGADVLVVSAKQSSVDQALIELPAGTSGRTLDVFDVAAIGSFFAEVGEFDHLVYTAGESLVLMPLAELDVNQARTFFQTRYFGALATVAAATPHIRAGGSITLTTGVAANRPRLGWSIGASVCGAVDALTRALAVELAPIRVNAVCPGVVRSPLWGEMGEATREEMYDNVSKSVLVGHVGETDEIAQAYLYCMTQTYATGSVLTVDGGAVLV
jgi:NAD(P)-dependent dehydrogenase (short-subunit alcohol dehydrogenase family)